MAIAMRVLSNLIVQARSAFDFGTSGIIRYM